MIYRDFQGDRLSLLGFGTMRLPLNADGSVDEAQTVEMTDASGIITESTAGTTRTYAPTLATTGGATSPVIVAPARQTPLGWQEPTWEEVREKKRERFTICGVGGR